MPFLSVLCSPLLETDNAEMLCSFHLSCTGRLFTPSLWRFLLIVVSSLIEGHIL